MKSPRCTRSLCVTLLLGVVLLAAASEAARYKGSFTVKSSKDADRFRFLAKFGYNTHGPGLFNATFTSNNPAQVVIAPYDDGTEWQYQWKDVYRNSKMTCGQKVNAQHPLTETSPGHAVFRNFTVAEFPDGKMTYNFHDNSRAHFWWFAAANCDDGSVFELTYDIHMQNAGDGAWDREFSYDQQGVLTMYIVFLCVWTVGLAVEAYAAFTLWRKECWHAMVRVLDAAILVEWFSLLFVTIHYGVYKDDGMGVLGLFYVGQALNMCSVLLFTLLLLLMAKGWAISTMELNGKWQLAVAMSVLAAAYVLLFFWGIFGVDPADTLYVYQSAPGIVLLVVRVLVGCFYGVLLFLTLRAESMDVKRLFYIVMGVVFGLWFLTLPAWTVVAAIVSEWVRYKVVIGLSLTSNTLFFGAFCYLTWPTQASKYFSKMTPTDLLDEGEAGPYQAL
jgi:GPR180/TMEM145, transmembrane domain